MNEPSPPLSRGHMIVIGALAMTVLGVLCLLGAVAFLNLYKRSVQQSAVQNTPTEIPTVLFPPTYTPTLPAGKRPAATRTLPPGPTPTPPVALLKALTKSEKAQVFRFLVDLTMKGDLGNFPANSGQELSMLNIAGEQRGADVHLTMRGFLSMFLGTDLKRGLEVSMVGGKHYVHGPAAILGAVDDKWYYSTAGSTRVAPLDLNDMWTAIGGSTADWSGFAKLPSESLDGKRCDVYRGDRDTTLALFSQLDDNQLGGVGNLDQVQNGESRLQVCDDGYLHQMRLSLEGHFSRTTSSTVILLTFHEYEFDGNFQITAPQNAAPLDFRFFGFPTPTPASNRTF